MAGLPRAKILIVDDSAFMRNLLRTLLSAEPRIEVIGMAADGLDALRMVSLLHPDLILMDIEMPLMDGLATLKQLRLSGCRIPVIVCSALTQQGALVTLEALALGAADYVCKPSAQASREAAIEELRRQLLPRILSLTGVSTHGFLPASATASPVRPYPSPVGSRPLARRLNPPLPEVVAIGVSTGGPAALDVLLPQLPPDFPLPVLIVQHMPSLFTKPLAERLDLHCRLRVKEAAEGEVLRPGVIYIAKGDWHMGLIASRPSHEPPHQQRAGKVTIHLTRGELENHCRPSVDVLFRSAAAVYGARVLGVILTGMGADGLEGCRVIRQSGGTVLAQDQHSSAIWGMPGGVAQAGLANRVVPLHQMAYEILRLTTRGKREANELRETAV